MADLRLCGKKVTNEQAKTIFTLMGALIVALVVVVIVSATGGGGGGGSGGDGGDDSAVPSGPRVSTNWFVETSSSDVRLSGANAQCSESGCSGRIEVKAPDPNSDNPAPVW